MTASAALVLSRGAGGPVGARRIALLEAIADHGSIAAAAKAEGLSYKGAWDAVQALNNLFDRPLVTGQAGGRGGGAASVTAEGRSVIAAFRLVQDELTRALTVLETRLGETGGAPLNALLWSLAMKTSARNALSGVVEKVIDGAVNAEVILDIGEGQRIVAIVTRESALDLGLAPGRRAVALIKSSFVILAPGEAPVRTSARNALRGQIVRLEEGAVNSEVVLSIGGGKTLTAIVTRESARSLGLDVGGAATALLKASHVILAVE
ncbi:MAG: TOBE domain-containing protein [Caulobacteraceae bacterium]